MVKKGSVTLLDSLCEGAQFITIDPFSVSVSVFDVQSHILKCNSQQILRISYFATNERYAGRGFAKLLVAHLKAVVAEISIKTNKEATLIVLSLAHTVPFWCSPSMGFLPGGLVAQALDSLNMADTTSVVTPTIQKSAD